MREIVLDTETTGLDPASGHRIVEIGCVELINHVPTGANFHEYINPERDMPQEAFAVHGLSEEFLADKPRFAEIAGDFLSFIGDAQLVIHNAGFDMKFINAELVLANMEPLPMSRAIDTVAMARRKFPGSRVNLDVLCRRFGIDNTARTKHGALLDAELLAEVYLELLGGRQPGLMLGADAPVPACGPAERADTAASRSRPAAPRPLRPHAPSAEELAAHEAFLDTLKDPLWRRGQE